MKALISTFFWARHIVLKSSFILFPLLQGVDNSIDTPHGCCLRVTSVCMLIRLSSRVICTTDCTTDCITVVITDYITLGNDYT